MIRLVDLSLVDAFGRYCADKPFGIRMAAALHSYGTDCSFADFWLALDDDRIVGAISKLDDDMTLCADEMSEEISEFIFTVGFNTLTAERAILESLGIESFSSCGAIMQYAGGYTCENLVGVDCSPSIMQACRTLARCEGESIRTGNFDRFYTDLALRVRRGTALCYGYGDKGVAIASAITEGGVIIGGVAVIQGERKRGIGGALVSRLVCDMPRDKKIYLLRLSDENESFYKALGFENVGAWASISRGCE